MLALAALPLSFTGLANAQRTPESFPDFDFTTARFKEGMIRILEDKGLYAQEERGVTFLSSTLFSAPIEVPARSVPPFIRRMMFMSPTASVSNTAVALG